MTEERLRDALRAQADSVRVGDGDWAEVERRAAAGRRARRVRVVGAGGLAVAAVVALVVGLLAVVGDDDGGHEVRVGPPATAPAVDDDAPLVIWISADGDQAKLAVEFARTYLRLPDPQVDASHSTAMAVGVRPRGRGPLTIIRMQSGYVGDGQGNVKTGWWVLGADAENLMLDLPAAGDTIQSPISLSGKSTAFEGTVQVEVRSLGRLNVLLGRSFYTGGANGEVTSFRHSMVFDRSPDLTGTVMLYTESAEDGSVQEATVVPVRFSHHGEPDAAEAPQQLLATTVDGDLVVVDQATGERRVLAAGLGNARRPLLGVASDGATAWVTRAVSDCDAGIQAVNLANGQAAPSFPGAAASVAPGGVRLAYVRPSSGRCGPDTLVVRDLESGAERTWRFEPRFGPRRFADTVEATAWSPDGRFVAVGVQYEDGAGILLVDLEHDRTLDDASPVRSFEADEPTTWRSPAFLPDGTLVAATTCCGHANDDRVLGVNALPVNRTVVANRSRLATLAAARQGVHLLYVTDEGELRWYGTDGEVSRGRGFRAATWLD